MCLENTQNRTELSEAQRRQAAEKKPTQKIKVKQKVYIGSLEYYIKLNLKLDFNRLILFEMRVRCTRNTPNIFYTDLDTALP